MKLSRTSAFALPSSCADLVATASTSRDLAHAINAAFTKTRAPPERTHSSQIVSVMEGRIMTEFQYLQEQAARAERLARNILDAVTVDRLKAFAAECREKAKPENACEPKAA